MHPQTKVVMGTFTAAGSPAAVNIDLGFIPDYVRIVGAGDTAGDIVGVEWFGSNTDSLIEKVVVDSGATGNKSSAWDGTNGLSALDETEQVPSRWTASTVYAVGDMVVPTTLNGYFYRCTTAGTSHSAEPTWLKVVGGTTSEGGGTVVWTCVDMGNDNYAGVRMTKRQGFTVPAAAQTASLVYHFIAIRCEKDDYTT